MAIEPNQQAALGLRPRLRCRPGSGGQPAAGTAEQLQPALAAAAGRRRGAQPLPTKTQPASAAGWRRDHRSRLQTDRLDPPAGAADRPSAPLLKRAIRSAPTVRADRSPPAAPPSSAPAGAAARFGFPWALQAEVKVLGAEDHAQPIGHGLELGLQLCFHRWRRPIALGLHQTQRAQQFIALIVDGMQAAANHGDRAGQRLADSTSRPQRELLMLAQIGLHRGGTGLDRAHMQDQTASGWSQQP